MTVTFGQNTEYKNRLKERKSTAVTELTDLLKLVSEKGHPEMTEIVLTIVSHPSDLALNPHPNAHMSITVLSDEFVLDFIGPNAVFSLVLYRLTTSHEAAFGFVRGSACITMRPMRFVEHFVPDDTPEDELEAQMDFVTKVIDALRQTFSD